MNTKNQPSILMPLPDGFAIGIGPNNQQYLVPQYMVPALDQAFAAYQSKADLGVLNARPGFSQTGNKPYIKLSEALFFYPPDPQLSDQETLSLHAEVVALQTKLGISYKDASHRLYIAELERLKAADAEHKAFNNLDRRLHKYLNDLNTRFTLKGLQSPEDHTAAHTHGAV